LIVRRRRADTKRNVGGSIHKPIEAVSLAPTAASFPVYSPRPITEHSIRLASPTFAAYLLFFQTLALQ
jgi:hypothetical protein